MLGVALRYWPMTLRAGALRPSHSSALVLCASARHCACCLGHLSVRVLSVFCCEVECTDRTGHVPATHLGPGVSPI